MILPPRVVAALLALLLPAVLRDAVLGDLAEEHATRTAADGRRAADRWYRRQAMRVAGQVVADRFRGLLRRRPSPGTLAAAAPRSDGPWRAVLSDVRYGVRHLARNPGFAATAILVIALGIGANTAILALANAVFVQPMPYPRAERLGLLSMEFGGVNQGGFSVSYRDMQDVMADASAFEEMAPRPRRPFRRARRTGPPQRRALHRRRRAPARCR